ncbi:MAG: helix-turn-helix domain-containing protein [Pirellula sp.]
MRERETPRRRFQRYLSIRHPNRGSDPLRSHLEATGGNRQEAAERLGISRMTLRAKTKGRNDESAKES